MRTDDSVLQHAISRIDSERSVLRSERCAFEEFLEAVRLAMPGDSKVTRKILEAYQADIMEALDYELVYGDTTTESIEQELSPNISEYLLSEEPFTQRRKRDLLTATARAIERRENFDARLLAERDAILQFDVELTEIKSTVGDLPECSLRHHSIERLLEVQERHDELRTRCKELLDRRQRQIRDAEYEVEIVDENPTLNEHLYRGLETTYPVLSAIAATVSRISTVES